MQSSSMLERSQKPQSSMKGVATHVDTGSGMRKRAWEDKLGGGVSQDSAKRRVHPGSRFSPVRGEASDLATMPLDLDEILQALSAFGLFIHQLQQKPIVGDLVLDIMSKSSGQDPQLVLCCIRLLTTSCLHSKIDSHKVVNVFVRSVMAEQSPYRSMILYETLQALRRWVGTDETKLSILGQSGVISFLIETLFQHRESPTTHCLALDLLRSMARCCSVARDRIASHVSSLLDFMKHSINDACIQQIGLSLLSWLAENKEIRNVLVREGGVSFLLLAMQQHANDKMVHCNATATLCWLIFQTIDEPTTPGPSVVVVANHSDTIRIVVKTMDRFMDNPAVWGNCICILSGLHQSRLDENTNREPQGVEDDENDDSLLDKKEILWLTLCGMKEHRDCLKVQRNCLKLLRLFTSSYPDLHLHVVVDLKGLDSIVDAMKRHSADAGIQTDACSILANLCSTREIQAMLMSNVHCIETMIHCQIEHHDKIRVQQAAMWFHDRLLQQESPTNVRAINAFGGGEAMINTMLLGVGIDLLPLETNE
jgi:hypothetical protein